MAAKRKLPTDATETVRRARGSLRGKMGNKPFAERMAKIKREEKELEERKLAKFEK